MIWKPEQIWLILAEIGNQLRLKGEDSMRNRVFQYNLGISSVQSLSRVRLFATPWIAARQVSLSITNSRSSLKLMSIASVMPSSHLILCRPLLLLPPTPPNIRVFSNELSLRMRWPKYWSFSFNIIPSKEHPGLIALHKISNNYKEKRSGETWQISIRLTSPVLCGLMLHIFYTFTPWN